jgi:hypothetical protein
VVGKIESNWKKENGEFNWNIVIPANASANVYVPVDGKISSSDKQLLRKLEVNSSVTRMVLPYSLSLPEAILSKPVIRNRPIIQPRGDISYS